MDKFLGEAGTVFFGGDITFGMSRELEDAKDADETNDPENGETHRLVILLTFIGNDRAQSYKVWHDSHNVNHVHYILKEKNGLNCI